MEKLKVFNPVAAKVRLHFKAAARVKNLKGKTIGLVWNGKGGGDIVLKRVADNLRRELRYEFNIKEFKDDFPFSPTTLEKVADTCHAVVGSTGD